MSDNSPRLSLPFMQPAQAQKHVTHNEALRILDALVQLSVEEFDATTPPAYPEDGAAYALGAGASGAWEGADDQLAVWFDSSWQFYTPQTGWIATVSGSADLRIWTGTGWEPLALDLQNLAGIGVNATSDSTNRLAVSSPATLFSHEGAGHQMKLNKAASTDTASLLYQSNWSGRAEMGLAGDDDFSIKLSSDGSTWEEALKVSPGMQIFHSGNIVGTVSETPGIGSAIIETGSGASGSYTKFADGTMICTVTDFATASGAAASWSFPAAFADSSISVTATLSAASAGVVTLSNISASSVDVYSFDMTGADSVSPDVHLMALGRWF